MSKQPLTVRKSSRRPRRPTRAKYSSIGFDQAAHVLHVPRTMRREISVTNTLVSEAYSRLSPFYDFFFGAPLQAGRVAAVGRMGHASGTRVLEVGVGTGINLPLYPSGFQIMGIDLSRDMLERSRQRIAWHALERVRLCEMDAAHMSFNDGSFDIVYAPYTISVVPDSLQVVREMRRVCRPEGKILILNHFRSGNALAAGVERIISPVTVHLGFKTDLDLSALLADAQLTPSSIERVNVPPIWSLVTCVNI
jgi:phosphatidylethanolamine/phosphatidyl-N-methylethanolamine N-methyltransferase